MYTKKDDVHLKRCMYKVLKYACTFVGFGSLVSVSESILHNDSFSFMNFNAFNNQLGSHVIWGLGTDALDVDPITLLVP